MKTVIDNRKARFDYFIEESTEAGIALSGCEVKSVKAGEASLADSYAEVTDGEMFLNNFYIKEYAAGSYNNLDTRRKRKLLLHKHEIKKLGVKVKEKGYTLIPIKVYLKDGRVKVEIGLCRGKHTYDKKAALKEKDIKRETERIRAREG